MADFLRGDFKDTASIELRKVVNSVYSNEMHSNFVRGLQTVAVMAQTIKRNKRIAKQNAECVK